MSFCMNGQHVGQEYTCTMVGGLFLGVQFSDRLQNGA